MKHDADRPDGYLAAIKAFAGTKICCRCHEPKSLSQFNRDRSQRDSFCASCRQCYQTQRTKPAK